MLRIWDPGSGCLFDPWIQNLGSGMGKNRDPDPGSGMNNPDHISESLETIFWLNSLMRIRDPRSGMEKFGSWIGDGKNLDLRSGINMPQH